MPRNWNSPPIWIPPVTTDVTPPSGHFVGLNHIFPVRVYYEDTDAGGILYHASHIRFFERGRTEMLRRMGLEQRPMRETFDLLFVVRRLEIDYLRPAHLDDSLQVQTGVLDIHGARVTLCQTLRRCEENHLLDAKHGAGLDLARAMVFLTAVNGRGKPTRLPITVAEQFSKLKAD